jgi:hypothetical protein
MAKKINGDSEIEDPRKALFAAIKSRGSEENDAATGNEDPRKALFSAIKNRKKQDVPDDDDESPASNLEYSRGVQRLQDFLNHSKTVLSLADCDQDAAIRACKVWIFLFSVNSHTPFCPSHITVNSLLFHTGSGRVLWRRGR